MSTTETDDEFNLSMIRSIIENADTIMLFYIQDVLSEEVQARYERVIGMKARIASLEEERCINAFMCKDRKLPTSQEKLNPIPE